MQSAVNIWVSTLCPLTVTITQKQGLCLLVPIYHAGLCRVTVRYAMLLMTTAYACGSQLNMHYKID